MTIVDREGDLIVEIADDGIGMDDARLDEALRLGSDTARVENDLGKFGMGLVTASISMSKRVEVFTRLNGGDRFYGGFDLEIIEESNDFVKWVQPIVANDKLFADWSTIIRLSKTDRISNRRPGDFANILRKRLGQVFRKFLKASTEITVNGRSVEAINPLMLTDKGTAIVYDEPLQIEGGTIHIRVVDLPDYGPAVNRDLGIIPQNSGFYIMRNNREIKDSETFEFYKKHPDFSHFRAEIEFDGSLDSVLHSDVKKMTITPPKSVLAPSGVLVSQEIVSRKCVLDSPLLIATVLRRPFPSRAINSTHAFATAPYPIPSLPLGPFGTWLVKTADRPDAEK